MQTFGPEPDLAGILTGPPEFDTTEWAPAQAKLIDDSDNRGLWYYKLDETEIRLIVPTEYQQGLATWQHKALLHASGSKVERALRKRFHWPDLSKEAAGGCSTHDAMRLTTHFRSKVYSGPRTVWSMD